MQRLAESLAQGKKAGTYIGAQEHELSVPKWMHWQLKPIAAQRSEAKAGMTQAEERISALERKMEVLSDDRLYQKTSHDYFKDLLREATEEQQEISSETVDADA
eukprot:3093471-Pyramimonas_sp.AAC.1